MTSTKVDFTRQPIILLHSLSSLFSTKIAEVSQLLSGGKLLPVRSSTFLKFKKELFCYTAVTIKNAALAVIS